VDPATGTPRTTGSAQRKLMLPAQLPQLPVFTPFRVLAV
jgi:hypothetical protein